jgi:hypothetical protein
MKTWHFYDKTTGLLTGNSVSYSASIDHVDDLVASQVPEGHATVEGVTDHLAQRVEAGELVDYQPPAPSVDHVWSEETKRWALSPGAAAKIARRAAACARIAALVDSQHEHVRRAVLGDMAALEKLRGIHAEIATLDAEAKSVTALQV